MTHRLVSPKPNNSWYNCTSTTPDKTPSYRVAHNRTYTSLSTTLPDLSIPLHRKFIRLTSGDVIPRRQRVVYSSTRTYTVLILPFSILK
jgi:hypothetical protein